MLSLTCLKRVPFPEILPPAIESGGRFLFLHFKICVIINVYFDQHFLQAIQRRLEEIEVTFRELEKQGIKVEQSLREEAGKNLKLPQIGMVFGDGHV